MLYARLIAKSIFAEGEVGTADADAHIAEVVLIGGKGLFQKCMAGIGRHQREVVCRGSRDSRPKTIDGLIAHCFVERDACSGVGSLSKVQGTRREVHAA